MTLNLRKSNVQGLLETEVVIIKETTDKKGKVTGQTFVTNEAFLGEEREIDNDTLIEIAEMLAATKDLAFQFTFQAGEEYPWAGGIYEWHDQIPPPSNEEEAKKLEGTPLYKFTGRWMSDEPDIAVFDRDMPNLLCQLVTALSELFVKSFFEEETT
jgi:hypothetical protein